MTYQGTQSTAHPVFGEVGHTTILVPTMTYQGTPSIGEIVRCKWTNDLLTVKDVSVSDDGQDTYVKAQFVEGGDERETRHVNDIEPREWRRNGYPTADA